MYYNDGLEKRKKNYSDIGERKCEEDDNENYQKAKLFKTSNVKFKEKNTKILKKIEYNYSKHYIQTDGNLKIKENKTERIPREESYLKLKNFKKKSVEMSIWISESFPIKISHFMPLIHILSFASNEFSDLKSALVSGFLPFDSFPLKICFPLGFSFHALLSVISFSNYSPPDSTFELQYTEKENRVSSFLRTGGDYVELDKNYANDFYAEYYLEQNMNGNGYVDDLDISSTSNFDRLREMFLTNPDDIYNIQNNGDLNDELKIGQVCQKNLDLLNSNDFNLNESERNYIHQSPLSNKITNINFTDVNFGFFNGELNFENGAALEFGDNQDSEIEIKRIKKINFKRNKNYSTNEEFSKKIYNYSTSKNDINTCTSSVYNLFLNEDLAISSEKINKIDKIIIKIPKKNKNTKFNKFNPGRIHINKKEQEVEDDINKLQITSKISDDEFCNKKSINSLEYQLNQKNCENFNQLDDESSIKNNFTEECLIMKETVGRNQIRNNQYKNSQINNFMSSTQTKEKLIERNDRKLAFEGLKLK
jgi:hypothetical protein